MDARIRRPRREYARRSFEAMNVSASRARAERAALQAILAKYDDRLLDDVGLTRAKAERLVSHYARLASLLGGWVRRFSRGRIEKAPHRPSSFR